MTRPRSIRGSAPVLALAAVAICGLGPGCRRAGDPVASLLEREGSVDRQRDGNGEAWAPAAMGDTFNVGDGLRTGAASRALLHMLRGGILRVGDNARLRFLRGTLTGPTGGAPEPQLAVDLGSAEIDGAEQAMTVLTGIGPVRVERGARLRVRSQGAESSLEVIVGRAVVQRPDGELVVERGHGLRIKLGGAEIERFRVAVGDAVVEPSRDRPAASAPAASAPAPPPVPDPAAAAPAARVAAPAPSTAGRAPAPRSGEDALAQRADVTLVAGESGVIHDGKPPLAVRLRFDRICSGEGMVELREGHHRREVKGAGAVVIRLGSGAERYQVRCADDPPRAKARASGLLTLKRDSADVPLSRRAPANLLEADGRRYTVMYQTQLPALTLAWPNAPGDAAGLSLHVESGRGEEVFATPRPERELRSGTLAEGTYSWFFTTADGRHSPRTTVTIRFDNAAPTAQFLRSGDAGSPAAAGAIAIDGVALEGAKVTAAGQALAVDDHGRFRARVVPLDGDDAVAVRLEHPRTGVHYYVRRAAGEH